MSMKFEYKQTELFYEVLKLCEHPSFIDYHSHLVRLTKTIESAKG